MFPNAFMGPFNFTNVLIFVGSILIELVTTRNNAASDNLLAAFFGIDNVTGFHLMAELPEGERRIAMGA
ncbi:unknown [Eggerthella sp. CAG:368]|nr:unknown [Eggerthella sp. CAG:368]